MGWIKAKEEHQTGFSVGLTDSSTNYKSNQIHYFDADKFPNAVGCFELAKNLSRCGPLMV